ncbi:MAG: sensor histidine kinase [Pseudobacter sp.]|uniref:sensor histidine kinase n=1 Tax=Pseudobacter sp. TaxID=2045420 RepID=UPI003F7DD48D
MSLRLLLTILAIYSCQFISGQTGLNFLRLGVNEGLSQNSVREIFQDQQGFIWIGTGDGLNRYDGIQIRKYRQSIRDRSDKRFPGKILNGKIHQDKQGNLWMMVDGQLVQMDLATETFRVIRQIGRDLEYGITGMKDDEVFIANASHVQVVNTKSRTVQELLLPEVFGMYISENRNIQLLFRRANAIYQFNYRTKQEQLLYQQGNDPLHACTIFSSSLLIIAGNRVIDFCLTRRSIISSYLVPGSVEYKSQSPLVKTPGGNIITVLPSKGIAIIDSATGAFTRYANRENDPYSLSSNLVYTATIDHSNNLWLGTEGGGISLTSLKPQLFSSFPDARQTRDESSLLMVKSLYHKNGKIYAGTYARGLYIIDRNTLQHKVVFAPPHKNDPSFSGVFFIREDKKGRIWLNAGNRIGIADPDKGIFLLSTNIEYVRKGNRHNILQCFTQIDSTRFIAGTVQSTYLIEDRNDQLLVSDLGQLNPKLEGDIQTIFTKPNGEIIVGKGEGKGLVVLRLNQLNQPELISTDLHGLTVKYVHRDESRQAFWYATNVGIVIRKDGSGTRTVIDEVNGLSNDFIYSIIPENNHAYWVSTNKGLNRISLEKSSFIQIKGVEQYAIQHGLQSNEFNTGAYFRDSNLIFFAGVTGINWFDHRAFFNRSFNARSYITDLLINETPLDTDTAINFLHQVKLKHNENNLLIKFATLDYTNASVNQYMYRLTGYDKSWIRASKIPEARYSKLPHGSYNFEIMSSNSEGVWSSPVTLLRIGLSPPFWLTLWFRFAVILTMVGIIIYVVKQFLKRKMEKQLRVIEQQLAVNNERLRISRDMHDELGTGLSKIALLSEVGKNHKAADHNKKIIHEISHTSRTLADKMGEIIWTLNPQNDTLGNLLAYLKEYIYETTDALPVSVNFSYPESIPDISLGHMQRQQLMLVTKEAINNALKHSNATQILFSLSVEAGFMSFSLKDNGTGLSTEKYHQHRNGKKNGLANMKARIEQISGQFSIRSAPGEGTEIHYSIPI